MSIDTTRVSVAVPTSFPTVEKSKDLDEKNKVPVGEVPLTPVTENKVNEPVVKNEVNSSLGNTMDFAPKSLSFTPSLIGSGKESGISLSAPKTEFSLLKPDFSPIPSTFAGMCPMPMPPLSLIPPTIDFGFYPSFLDSVNKDPAKFDASFKSTKELCPAIGPDLDKGIKSFYELGEKTKIIDEKYNFLAKPEIKNDPVLLQKAQSDFDSSVNDFQSFVTNEKPFDWCNLAFFSASVSDKLPPAQLEATHEEIKKSPETITNAIPTAINKLPEPQKTEIANDTNKLKDVSQKNDYRAQLSKLTEKLKSGSNSEDIKKEINILSGKYNIPKETVDNILNSLTNINNNDNTIRSISHTLFLTGKAIERSHNHNAPVSGERTAATIQAESDIASNGLLSIASNRKEIDYLVYAAQENEKVDDPTKLRNMNNTVLNLETITEMVAKNPNITKEEINNELLKLPYEKKYQINNPDELKSFIDGLPNKLKIVKESQDIMIKAANDLLEKNNLPPIVVPTNYQNGNELELVFEPVMSKADSAKIAKLRANEKKNSPEEKAKIEAIKKSVESQSQFNKILNFMAKNNDSLDQFDQVSITGNDSTSSQEQIKEKNESDIKKAQQEVLDKRKEEENIQEILDNGDVPVENQTYADPEYQSSGESSSTKADGSSGVANNALPLISKLKAIIVKLENDLSGIKKTTAKKKNIDVTGMNKKDDIDKWLKVLDNSREILANSTKKLLSEAAEIRKNK